MLVNVSTACVVKHRVAMLAGSSDFLSKYWLVRLVNLQDSFSHFDGPQGKIKLLQLVNNAAAKDVSIDTTVVVIVIASGWQIKRIK